MEEIKPIYKKFLIAAVIIYIIGTCIMLSDLYCKIGNVEHVLSHLEAGHKH